MKKMKKTIAMLMVYLMAVTLLPIGGFTTIANAEENIPKYSKTTDLYFSSVFQYKDKALVAHKDKETDDGSGRYTSAVSFMDKDNMKIIEGNFRNVNIRGEKNKAIYQAIKEGVIKEYNFDTNEVKDYKASYEEKNKEIEKIQSHIKEEVIKKFDIKDAIYVSMQTEYRYNNKGDKLVYFNVYVNHKDRTPTTFYFGTIIDGKEFLEEGNIMKISFNDDSTVNVFISKEDEKSTKYEVLKIRNEEATRRIPIDCSNSKWVSCIQILENKIFLDKHEKNDNSIVREYWLEGNDYKEKNSYEVDNNVERLSEDCNGNLWTLKTYNDKKYVCKLENGNIIKKYEVEPYMKFLYVYDENNIIATSYMGSTIINNKDNDVNPNPPVEEDKKVETKPVITPGEKETKVEVKEKLTPNATNVVKADNVTGKAEVILTDIETIKNENGAIEVTINGNETVRIPFAAISKNIPEGAKSVTVALSTEENSDILKGLKAVGKVYNFDLTVEDKDGNKIILHNFTDGVLAEITLTLSDQELNGVDREKATVYYYNEETKKFEAMETRREGKNIIFKTPHFSKYIIAEEIEFSADKVENKTALAGENPKTGDTNNIPMLLAVVAISLIGVLVITKKNLKSSEK